MQKDIFGGYMPKKQCPYCKRVKDISEFYISKGKIQSYCKDCQKIYKQRHPKKEYKRERQDYYSLNIFEDERDK